MMPCPQRGGLEVALLGVGLLGPGLPDWPRGRRALTEPASWAPAPVALPAPSRLPAAERRRTGDAVRLALAVAEQACAQAGCDPAEPATVFASASGDAQTFHVLCQTLASAERAVSPTRFTNSVHNAAAGYWHIGAASRAPSTSIAGHDTSFAAGLLEAASQCVAGERCVLLVASDMPYPEPMHAVRPLAASFGVALLLGHAATAHDAQVRLRLTLAGDGAASFMDDARLEALRRGVPAARALPLLQALARGAAAAVRLDGAIPLTVALCAARPERGTRDERDDRGAS